MVTAKAVTDNGTSEEVVYTVIILGDLSGDGLVKINDGVLVAKTLNGAPIDDVQRMAADISQDGVFKINDAVLLAKKLDKWNDYNSMVR